MSRPSQLSPPYLYLVHRRVLNSLLPFPLRLPSPAAPSETRLLFLLPEAFIPPPPSKVTRRRKKKRNNDNKKKKKKSKKQMKNTASQPRPLQLRPGSASVPTPFFFGVGFYENKFHVSVHLLLCDAPRWWCNRKLRCSFILLLLLFLLLLFPSSMRFKKREEEISSKWKTVASFIRNWQAETEPSSTK